MDNNTGRRPNMRDVTGDEDHFGPGKEESRLCRPSNDDEDSYEAPPKRASAGTSGRSSNKEKESENRNARRDPDEESIRKGKENYNEADFKGEVVGGGEGVVVPEDVYEVECIDVIPSMMKDKFKGNVEVPKIKFVFNILNDPDYEGVHISRILNRNYALKSNLVEYYIKITGEEIEKGDSIDTRKCKGKKCRISVSTYIKEGTTEKKNKITEILSAKRSKPD